MPSPIAHSLVGLTIGHLPEPMRGRLLWVGLALFAANAPDLDFLAGLVSGSINAYHGGPSHSLGAALAFSALASLVLRRQGCRPALVFAVSFAIYTSHILLDMACEASPTRPGLPLFWPLSNASFLFPWRPFLGIAHGGDGGGPAEFLHELFSLGNFAAVALEVAVFAPPLWIACRRWGAPEWLTRLLHRAWPAR
jgi:membrane-bound metal-dependent hydrolase YbcI (DUF457 family)